MIPKSTPCNIRPVLNALSNLELRNTDMMLKVTIRDKLYAKLFIIIGLPPI
jgi:hypothetical protein